jgi:hypothetical protein
VDSSGDRAKQAEAIRVSSIAFAEALSKVIPPAGVTLYMHFLVMHVPDMIERHGNVVRFGGQGLSMLALKRINCKDDLVSNFVSVCVWIFTIFILSFDRH